MGPACPCRPYHMDLIHYTVDSQLAARSRARFNVVQHEPELWKISRCGVMSLSPFLRQSRLPVGKSRCFPTVCLAAPWQLCRSLQELTPINAPRVHQDDTSQFVQKERRIHHVTPFSRVSHHMRPSRPMVLAPFKYHMSWGRVGNIPIGC